MLNGHMKQHVIHSWTCDLSTVKLQLLCEQYMVSFNCCQMLPSNSFQLRHEVQNTIHQWWTKKPAGSMLDLGQNTLDKLFEICGKSEVLSLNHGYADFKPSQVDC